MSKASLPQGPDKWYLTFFENEINHITNHNVQLPLIQALKTVEQNQIISQELIERVGWGYKMHKSKRSDFSKKMMRMTLRFYIKKTMVSFANAKFARHPNLAQNESLLIGHTNFPFILKTIKKII